MLTRCSFREARRAELGHESKAKALTLGRKDPPLLGLSSCSPTSMRITGNSPLPAQATVTASSTLPGKHLVVYTPGPFFRTLPNLHVVQSTPAAVRVPRAQTLPTGCVLFTGLHGDPGDLAERRERARLDQVGMTPTHTCTVTAPKEVTLGDKSMAVLCSHLCAWCGVGGAGGGHVFLGQKTQGCFLPSPEAAANRPASFCLPPKSFCLPPKSVREMGLR